MNGAWIESQADAIRVACMRTTPRQLEDLHSSFEQASRTPAAVGWEHKAAAHAEIFNVLAAAAGDPLNGSVLSGGVAVAYDLMITAGRVADGMVASSRKRFLAHLRAAEHQEAALEMEKHLRVLHYMWRLANPAAPGSPLGDHDEALAAWA